MNETLRQRWDWFRRAAFAISGLLTVLGGGFYYFIYLWAKDPVNLQLCLVLAAMGFLAMAIPFMPEAWLGGLKAEERRRFGYRFLLVAAAVGVVFALIFALSPPYKFLSIREAVFWLCPGCAPGMLNGQSFAAILFTALLNAVFFGAGGGVVGTALSMVNRRDPPSL